MIEQRTEAQLYTAAMMRAVGCALDDLLPDKVSESGTLWQGRIVVWGNDIFHMVIDHETDEAVRVTVFESEKQSDGSEASRTLNDYILPLDAGDVEIQNFVEDIVVGAADLVHIDPKQLVHKISEVAADVARLQGSLEALGAPKPADPYKPA